MLQKIITNQWLLGFVRGAGAYVLGGAIWGVLSFLIHNGGVSALFATAITGTIVGWEHKHGIPTPDGSAKVASSQGGILSAH